MERSRTWAMEGLEKIYKKKLSTGLKNMGDSGKKCQS